MQGVLDDPGQAAHGLLPSKGTAPLLAVLQACSGQQRANNYSAARMETSQVDISPQTCERVATQALWNGMSAHLPTEEQAGAEAAPLRDDRRIICPEHTVGHQGCQAPLIQQVLLQLRV